MASVANVAHTPVDKCLNLTTTTKTALYTAPTSGVSTGGAKIGVFRVIGADTVGNILSIYKTIDGTDYLLGTVVVSSGTLTSPSISDVISLIWGDSFNLAPGTVLSVKLNTATTTNPITVHMEGATF